MTLLRKFVVLLWVAGDHDHLTALNVMTDAGSLRVNFLGEAQFDRWLTVSAAHDFLKSKFWEDVTGN